MKHHESVAQISAQLKSMFTAAGGLLLMTLLVTITIEMGFEQSVPVVVYAIMGVLLLGIFAFYGLNIYALMRISTAPVKKEISYKNSELEVMTALTVQQAATQLALMQRQPPALVGEQTFVKQKALRKRKVAPQIAPSGDYPVLKTSDADVGPTLIPDNVVPIKPISGDDDELS